MKSWSQENVLWATQDGHRQGGGFSEREKEEPHPKRLSVKARQLVDWRLENYFSQQSFKYLVKMTCGYYKLCSIF